MAVDTQHDDYVKMLLSWKTMEDVCSCQEEIYLNETTYLPRLSSQTDDEYKAYQRRASFTLFTKRTIEAFTGMVMRKDVEVSGVDLLNIDGKGGDINSYVEKLLKEYLTYRRCGTLVDLPAVDKEEVLTVADEIEKNITPRLALYDHDTIINWKTKEINNIEVLSMVVLRETVDKENGDEFSHDTEYKYRVLDLSGGHYRQRIFGDDLQQVGDEIFPERNSERLNFIPFKIHGGIDVDYPTLLAVADENIHHYQLDATYKHGLHFIALPTPWISSDLDPTEPEDMAKLPSTLGPTNIWAVPSDSQVGMLEFMGTGIGKIESGLDRIVETIVILASRILAPEKSSNDESALAAAIRANAETSTLAGVAKLLSADIKEALQIAMWWSKKDPTDVVVKINSDFMPLTLSGADMLSYVTAWIKGGISYESLYNVLKRGEIIEGNRDIKDEIADIEKEQKERLDKEVTKTEKIGKAEGKSEEDEDLPTADAEQDIAPDLQLK